MDKESFLNIIMNDIKMLRGLMHEISLKVERLDDPLLIRISEILDVKLNQHHQITQLGDDSHNKHLYLEH